MPTPYVSSVRPPPAPGTLQCPDAGPETEGNLNQHLQAKTDASSAAAGSAANLMMRGQGLNMTPSVVALSGVASNHEQPPAPPGKCAAVSFPPNYGMGPRPHHLTSPFFPGSPHRPGSQLFVWIQMNLATRDARKPARAAAHQESRVQCSVFPSLSSATTLSPSTGLTLRITRLGGHASECQSCA